MLPCIFHPSSQTQAESLLIGELSEEDSLDPAKDLVLHCQQWHGGDGLVPAADVEDEE